MLILSSQSRSRLILLVLAFGLLPLLVYLAMLDEPNEARGNAELSLCGAQLDKQELEGATGAFREPATESQAFLAAADSAAAEASSCRRVPLGFVSGRVELEDENGERIPSPDGNMRVRPVTASATGSPRVGPRMVVKVRDGR